jgi:phage terminase large subunit-like protein
MAKPERLLPPATDLIAYLKALPLDLRIKAVALLSPEERLILDREWPEWAHAGQLPPGGDWRSWVIMAGRGFGKTRAGAEWVTSKIRKGRKLRIALVGATIDEARRVMVEGQSGLLNVVEPWIAGWSPSRLLLRFKGGSEATLFSGASPNALRGPEHDIAWCDELAKWEKAGECWDMLQLGLRLGKLPSAVITTTPRPGPVLTRIMAQPGCITTGGPTYANPYLPDAFKENVTALYAGTRLGRQELGGELLTDTPGALWTVEVLERCRLAADTEEVARTVIGVDPPAVDGTCGIVVCARDREGIAHVLADHSVTGLSPDGWARAVANAALVHAADRIVAEKNQGGKMVEAVLHAAGPRLRVKTVTAHVGKSLRAEPVALLFESGKVRLHGRFPELEAELLGMIAGGGYEGPGASPDRADAMVWALTELMLGPDPSEPRVRRL